jgi:hypothetical protein
MASLVFPSESTGGITAGIGPLPPRFSDNCKIFLPTSLRYRLLSETRVAVCLILGPVFVLF